MNSQKFFLLFIALFLLNTSQAGILQACRDFFKHDPSVNSSIRWNFVVTWRPLQEYKSYLHHDFKTSLEALTSSQTWIDLGGGKGNAVVDFLKGFRALRHAPKVVLVTYKLGRLLPLPAFEGKLSVMKERLWEDIPQSEIPKSKLITDFLGVISYSRDLKITLDKVFKALEKNGELYIFTDNSRTMLELGGKVISLTNFLKTVPGIKVDGRDGVLKITKIAEEVILPQLKLIQLDEKVLPPFRRYQIIH